MPIINNEVITLTSTRAYPKPFAYPYFYELADRHEQLTWNRRHVKTLNEDIADFQYMQQHNPDELAPLEAMLLYFTQVDTDVAASYFKNLARFYSLPEILMWIARVANREATHFDCYDMLPAQFGIPEDRYKGMLEIHEVMEQHIFMSATAHTGDFWDRISTIVKHIAGEGIGIYGVFIPLVNYSLYGRMKSVGQEIVSWSARDENEHVVGLTYLFNTEVQENAELYTEAMRETLLTMIMICVTNTLNLIDYFYSLGTVKHLTADEVKLAVKQIANKRSEDINLGTPYPEVVGTEIHPAVGKLFTGSELSNFFETSNTSYGFYSGDWVYPENADEIIPDWELEDHYNK